MCGKAVATRLQVGSDVPVDVGTKGLRSLRSRVATEDSVGRYMADAQWCASASLAGSDAVRGGCSEEQPPLAAD